LDSLIAHAQKLEAQGFHAMSMANIFGYDAIGALTLVGHNTSKIELSTAVVPTYPRHPTAIAQQALTAQAASKGRFTLGIGLSHKVVIENMLGMSYDKPALHMREYLEILSPLLRGEQANFDGDQYRTHAALQVPDAKPVALWVAALGPVMLKLAGRLADGTVLWMTGPKTIEGHIRPGIAAAAEEAGKPAPRIAAGFPVAVTTDPDGARTKIGEMLQMYGQLPSYRAMLDREGAAGPADMAIVGDEGTIRDQIRRLEEAGVTDFQAVAMPLEEGMEERTLDMLSTLT
ncbi:MAG: TIGR03564 family F420-dependent LLM class oxidoreductase, partial [Pseudomonadota bacterium]